MCKELSPLESAIQFHGHICPGLIMGVRAAEFARLHLGIQRDRDEELLAIVETDSCGVDALQSILGCTFGKGNLIFKDYGKNVYTIAVRNSGKAVRIAQRQSPAGRKNNRYRELKTKAWLDTEEQAEMQRLLQETVAYLITCPFDDLFLWQEVDIELPSPAGIYNTVICASCGEGVMETRAVRGTLGLMCQPCQDKEDESNV